jgi:acetolactate synthase small subunit
MDNIKILETAINDIENWKGQAYQEGDDVGLALESIKEVIDDLKVKRIDQINRELFMLKIDLNSNYGVGESEVKRLTEINERVVELKEELKKLEKN